MSIGQYAIIIATAILAVCVGVGIKYSSRRATAPIIASLVLVFYAVLMTNFLAGNISGMSELSVSLTFLALVIVSVGLGIFVRSRRVLFWISVVIFSVGMIDLGVKAIQGISGKYETFLPGHLCRQVSYLWPIVYFSGERFRRWVMPFMCYASLTGGIFVICLPGTVFGGEYSWSELDSVISHSNMIFVPIAILVTKQVKPHYLDAAIGTPIYLCMMLFGFMCAAIVKAQTGTWGDHFFLSEAPGSMSVLGYQFVAWGFAVLLYFGLSFLYQKCYDKEHDEHPV